MNTAVVKTAAVTVKNFATAHPTATAAAANAASAVAGYTAAGIVLKVQRRRAVKNVMKSATSQKI